jgi:hypothetical protein
VIAVDHDDDLPAPIAEQMEAAGLAPEIAVLQDVIAAFVRARAAPKARPSLVPAFTEQWPLKALLPSHVSYEVARRAAVKGTLRADLTGKRWFSTKPDVDSWIAATGRAL